MTLRNATPRLSNSQSAIDSLPIGLMWLDKTGKMILVNRKLTEEVNWNVDRLKTLHIKEICPSFQEESWETEWATFQEVKVSVKRTEMMTELGFFFPVQIIFSLSKQGGKDILLGIVQNLLETDQDELLKDTDNEYNRIGRWELDVLKEKTVLTSNCYDILKINIDNPPLSIGDHESFFEQALNKEQLYQLQAMLNTSFDENLPTELELCLQPTNHKNLWIHFRIRPIVADGIVVKIVGTIQDISQFKKKDEELKIAFSKIEELNKQLKVENLYLQKELEKAEGFEEIITNSPKYRKILQQINEVASTDATVLITGETGTGKELVARAVHRLSNRSRKPLIKVNCAAIPENLIESELFGHERGAFTGAVMKKLGRFELADQGTIFLDEIGELPLMLQSKLLRVLQEGEISRLGSNRVIKLDVRIITATNRKLERLIEEGKFREDLYYRLNVYPIENLPLRERREDIPLLVSYFAKKYSEKIGKNIDSVSQLTIDRLMQYPFPGNIRELQNIIERAVIQNKSSILKLTTNLLGKATFRSAHEDRLKTFEEMQKEHILKVLKHTRWKVSGQNSASEILGMNSNTLESKMRKLGIKRKDFMK